jgi:hypothetical protein
MEDEPAMAEKIIHRAVNKIQIAMNEYEPDGAYPEGPGYWSYGTTYNVLMLAGLDSVLGTDFGLSKKNGFAKSANYFLHVTGPTGLYFNYPDSRSEFTFKPVVFWFAKTYNQPSLTWNVATLWKEAMEHDISDLMRDRTSVLALMWASSSETSRPKALSWMGQGINHVALFRTSWDEDAVFLGFKGGTPRSNHGHMDIGSFVLDAEGVRWAVDLGPESYYKIESRGISLWDRKQGGSRWKIFRYNNFSHNTLTVNQKLQRVDGFAPIIRYSDHRGFAHAVVDMTEVYKGQLAKALRGAGIVESETIVIQDELQAADSAATVRWSMVTPATVEIVSDNSALLKQKGKVLQFRVVSDADVKLGTFSTEPRADYDAQNPGTRMIGFDVLLEPGQHQTVRVMMAAGTEEGPLDTNLKNVEAWSELLE